MMTKNLDEYLNEAKKLNINDKKFIVNMVLDKNEIYIQFIPQLLMDEDEKNAFAPELEKLLKKRQPKIMVSYEQDSFAAGINFKLDRYDALKAIHKLYKF